jgi:signal transduction histidine kinase
VIDRGSGIAEETRGRLFESFYSGSPHGVGLGLALVKQIVDAHRAKIEVASTPGSGSTFHVCFAPPPVDAVSEDVV